MTIQDQMMTAIHAYGEGRFTDAEAMLLEILESTPEHAPAHTLLARILMMLDRVGDALAIAHAATRLDPDSADAFAAFGDALRMLGENEHARDVFAHATLLAPKRSEIFIAYGQTLLAVGDNAHAVATLMHALQLEPSCVEGYRLLCQALMRQGRTREALQSLQTALAFAPRDADLHLEVGHFCRHIGALEEALACYENVAELVPEAAAGLINAGIVLRAMGRTQDAAARQRAAMQLDPNEAAAPMNLGLCLRDMKRFDEAETVLRDAVRLAPDDARAHYNLGTTLLDAKRPAAACLAFDEAVRLDPEFASAHVNRGVALEIAGALDDAEAAYRRALALDATLTRPHLQLARMNRLPDPKPVLALLDEEGRDAADQLELRAAAAIAADACGDHDLAAAHMLAKSFAMPMSWNADAFDLRIERTIDATPKGFADDDTPRTNSTFQPIFIVGAPRSGIALVEHILAAHPSIYGAGERSELEECGTAALHTFARGVTYPEFIPTLEDAQLHVLADAYAMKLYQAACGAAAVVDATPSNAMHLGLIARMFPQAKIIHVRRHPLDTALSCFLHSMPGTTMPWAGSLEGIARYLNAHDRLMAHWSRVLPMPILELDYEAVVGDVRGVVQRVLNFVEMPWNPAVLTPELQNRVAASTTGARLRTPIDDASVGRWKHYVELLRPVIEGIHAPIAGLDRSGAQRRTIAA